MNKEQIQTEAKTLFNKIQMNNESRDNNIIDDVKIDEITKITTTNLNKQENDIIKNRNIYKKIFEIQLKLEVAKNRKAYSKGGILLYNYCNLYDILDVLKKFQEKYKLLIQMRTEMYEIKDSFLKMEAFIEIIDIESNEKIIYSKKGLIDLFRDTTQQDKALNQKFGGWASYTYKYLLCDIFAIQGEIDDDEKDGLNKNKSENLTTHAEPTLKTSANQNYDAVKCPRCKNGFILKKDGNYGIYYQCNGFVIQEDGSKKYCNYKPNGK